MTPTLLMDEFGVIVGCYLPDILLPDVQVSHLSPAHDCHSYLAVRLNFRPACC